jgi:putative Mg2+ transporter-C (MgtC) family protein
MAAIRQCPKFLNSLASPALAFLPGTLIGSKRQYRHRTAGLRANALVSVGGGGLRRPWHEMDAGAAQVVACVVSGVGWQT